MRERKPIRLDKDGNEILAYKTREEDVVSLTCSDLESRARTAKCQGIEGARKLVAESALAWATKVLGEENKNG